MRFGINHAADILLVFEGCGEGIEGNRKRSIGVHGDPQSQT